MNTFLIFLLQSVVFAGPNPQVLMVDSSFPPLKDKQFVMTEESCYQIAEDNSEIPDKGECFSSKTWDALKKEDVSLIEGMQDSLAGIKSTQSEGYDKFQNANKDAAKKLRTDYILSVHGTRSAYVVGKYSDFSAEIIPVRVVTAQAGTVQQAGGARASTFERYGNNCQLRKWDKKTEQSITKGSLQPYQERIQKVIDANSNLRLISISLGYKKSWIGEDNAACKPEYVATEYKILKDSWKNLLRKNKTKLFIVAAGNESADFDQQQNKEDDLWADLSSEPNLLLVGSLQENGERFKSSNFGKMVVMTKGEQIESLSPLPTADMKGHKTTLRGTSFSAPILTGLAVKALKEDPKIDVVKLKEKITASAKTVH